MDLNDLRSLATLSMFLAFIGIVVYAWNSRRRGEFDSAAQVPLLDDGTGPDPTGEKA